MVRRLKSFFFICMSLFTHNIHACIQTQRTSLLSFALDLSSPSFNWTSGNCCYWEGITCSRDGWVTHLQLPSKGLKLKGDIFPSSSLANLTHLTHLNLSHNSLSGSLDQSETFLSLNHLEILDLSFNLLFGMLPSFLPSTSHIQLVDFSSNRLHGVIPSSFFQQAWKLTGFNVSNNTFSGPIPPSICLPSSSLRHLDFSLNNFNGSIPRGFGKCSELQVLRAGYNYLSGSLPEDIFNSTSLEEISLPLNSLNGAISDGIANLINLTTLDLCYNQLSGVLPLHLGKLSKLKQILLDFNSLEGSLPLSLMNCTKLVELRMGANNLGGDISMLDFSKLSQLSKLDLRMNNFFGVLPRSLYSCKFLKAIRVSYNNLEVQIQPEIASLKSLSFLSLGVNKRLTNVKEAMKILMGCKSLVVLSLASSFVGEEFPTDLGKADFDGFQNLRILDLSSCNLTGQLPLWLSKLRKLESLSLSHNRITGSIPSWIGSLPRLYSIIMDFNLLSGKIPKELWMLPMLVSEQAAATAGTALDLPYFYPSVDYAKPIQYNYLYYEAMISLKSNNLYGNIPSEIGQSQLLTYLDLSNNNLSGNIPEQIANIKGMRQLDLSMNQLSGNIPTSFTSLHFLSKLNVSFNNLEGPIPSSTQLQSFNASAFEGNRNLCGDPLPKCKRTKGTDEPDMNNTDADMKEHQFPWFYISAALGFIIGFWGVFGPLVLLKKWRYAYYHFLDNGYERFMVMILKRMARLKRRFSRS
uniref:receptor-like protein 2 n=1 Tax=Fragaria vesca subsp. vesca TaxID=101020 RepID=UPI0005C99ABA|nr:PREDICTED: receptor-like protein 2 [Fragaria vesca subsp. vesca]